MLAKSDEDGETDLSLKNNTSTPSSSDKSSAIDEVIDTDNFPFDKSIHLLTTNVDANQVKEIRQKISEARSNLYENHQSWLTDVQIYRFLIARNFKIGQ